MAAAQLAGHVHVVCILLWEKILLAGCLLRPIPCRRTVLGSSSSTAHLGMFTLLQQKPTPGGCFVASDLVPWR